MPEETEGKPDASAAPGTVVAAPEGKSGDDKILGKFESQEALEKAYQSVESEASKMAQERAALARELEALKEKTQLGQTLERLNESLAAKADEPQDFETFYAEHEDDWCENPAHIARDMGQMYKGWQEQSQSAIDARIKALEEASKSGHAELSERMVKQSQEYVENREAIEALVAENIPLDRAMALAVKFGAPDSELAERLRPSASVQATVVPETAEVKDEFYFSSDAEEAAYLAERGVQTIKGMAALQGKKLRGKYE